MEPRSSYRIVVVLTIASVLLAGILFWSHRTSTQASNDNKTEFVYAAKFVCGQGGTNALGWTDREPGSYLTAINVYNPQSTSVTLTKEAVLAPRALQGTSLGSKSDTLYPDSATEVICADVPTPLGTGSSIGNLEGFVVLKSPERLAVTAVYTYCAQPSSSDSGAGSCTVGGNVDVTPVQPETVTVVR